MSAGLGVSEPLTQGLASEKGGEEVGQLIRSLHAYLCLQEAGSGAWRGELKR